MEIWQLGQARDWIRPARPLGQVLCNAAVPVARTT